MGEITHQVRSLKHFQILGRIEGSGSCVEPFELVVLLEDKDAEMLDSCLPGCTMLLPEQSQLERHILMKAGH